MVAQIRLIFAFELALLALFYIILQVKKIIRVLCNSVCFSKYNSTSLVTSTKLYIYLYKITTEYMKCSKFSEQKHEFPYSQYTTNLYLAS